MSKASEIIAAQKIFDIFCGGSVDWANHSLDDKDDNIFLSADWAQALLYARAALEAVSSIHEAEPVGENGELDAGINYAIERLCEILDVDPKSISWDAATETMDGDVSSVICNALRAAYGEEWSSKSEDTARIKVLMEQAVGEKPRDIAKRAARDLVAAMASKDPLIRDLIKQTARVLYAHPAPISKGVTPLVPDERLEAMIGPQTASPSEIHDMAVELILHRRLSHTAGEP